MGFLVDDDEDKKKKKRGFLHRLLIENPTTQLASGLADAGLSVLRGSLELGEEIGGLADRGDHPGEDRGSPHVVSGWLRDRQQDLRRATDSSDPGAEIVRQGGRAAGTVLGYLLGGAGAKKPIERAARGLAVDLSIPAEETGARALRDYTGVELPGANTTLGAKAWEGAFGFGLGYPLDAWATARGATRAADEAYRTGSHLPELEAAAAQGDEGAGALASEIRSTLPTPGERAVPQLGGRGAQEMLRSYDEAKQAVEDGWAVRIGRKFYEIEDEINWADNEVVSEGAGRLLYDMGPEGDSRYLLELESGIENVEGITRTHGIGMEPIIQRNDALSFAERARNADTSADFRMNTYNSKISDLSAKYRNASDAGRKALIEQARKIADEASTLGIKDIPDPEDLLTGSAKIVRGGEEGLNLRDPAAVKSWFDDIYQGLFDKDYPIAAAAANSKLRPSRNPAITIRQVYGANAHATNVRRFGVVRPNSVDYLTDKGLDQILKESGDVDKLEKYLIAKRADDYRPDQLSLFPGGKKALTAGFTENELNAFRKLGEQDPLVLAAADDLKNFNDQLLRLLEEEGVLQPGAVKKIKASGNDFYVPFFRQNQRRFSMFGSSTKDRKALKVREDDNSVPENVRLLSPVESMVQQIYSYSELMFRRRAMVSLQDLSAELGKGNGIFEDLGTVAPRGMKEADDSALLETILSPELLRHMDNNSRSGLVAHSDFDGNPIYAMRAEDGETHYYKTTPEILNALTVRAPHEYGMVSKFMIGTARALRTGVTIMPDFWISNRIRDAVFATVSRRANSPLKEIYSEGPGAKEAMESIGATYHGFATLLSDGLSSAMGREVPRESLMRLWENSGGAFGELTSMDRVELRRMINYMFDPNPSKWRQLKNIATKIGETANAPSRAVENIERMKEFKRIYGSAMAAGMSPEDAAAQAAAASRDITVDFARRGLAFDTGNDREFFAMKGEFLRLSDAFFNAALQGHSKLWRTLFSKNPAERRAAIYTATSLITAPAMANYAMNREDASYWNRPAYERRMYFLLKVPGATNVPGILAADDEGGIKGFIKNFVKPFSVSPNNDGTTTVYLRIPMPHELGLIFGGGLVSMVEAVDPANPYRQPAAEGLASSANQMVRDQLLSFLPIPQVAQLGIETGFNTKFHTGNPLMSDAQKAENVSPRYKGTKGPFPDAVSGMLGDLGADQIFGDATTPAAVQHLIEGVSGGMGRVGIDVANALMWDDNNRGPRPTLPISERAVIDRFLTDFAPQASESFGRFYEEFNSLEKRENDRREAGKRLFGDLSTEEMEDALKNSTLPEARRIREDSLTDIEYRRFEVMKDIADHISSLGTEMRQAAGATNPDARPFRENISDFSDKKQVRLRELGLSINLATQLATFNYEARQRFIKARGEDYFTPQEQKWIDALDEIDKMEKQGRVDQMLFGSPWAERVRMARMLDGDSGILATPDSTEVRLLNHFAPEWGEPGGPEAKSAAEELLLGRDLELDPGSRSRDKYGRLITRIRPEGSFDAGDSLRSLVKQGGRGL